MELAFNLVTVMAVLKIIAIDIILSGDNAIVIAMATRKLPEKKRNVAILWGTAGAVILRVLFASIIAILLEIPFVHFVGGLLLLWISYKVLVNHEDSANVKAKDTMMAAIWTIIMADAAMSLDNVVAIAGASHGSVLLIFMGVLVSIPIMIFFSKLIVRIMERHPIVTYIGSGILAWTASGMIFGDERVAEILNIEQGIITFILNIVLTALILVIGYVSNKKYKQQEANPV